MFCEWGTKPIKQVMQNILSLSKSKSQGESNIHNWLILKWVYIISVCLSVSLCTSAFEINKSPLPTKRNNRCESYQLRKTMHVSIDMTSYVTEHQTKWCHLSLSAMPWKLRVGTSPVPAVLLELIYTSEFWKGYNTPGNIWDRTYK